MLYELRNKETNALVRYEIFASVEDAQQFCDSYGLVGFPVTYEGSYGDMVELPIRENCLENSDIVGKVLLPRHLALNYRLGTFSFGVASEVHTGLDATYLFVIDKAGTR